MEKQGYFLDQLCMIAVGAAYGGILVSMFYEARTSVGQQTLLSIVVGWIQMMILIGGIVLLILALLRGVAVWQLSRQWDAMVTEAHSHACCHAEHGTDDHGHGHSHHDHSHGDHGHSHAWAPWRYTVLVFPLMLYLLPLNYDRLIRQFARDRAKEAGEHGPQVPLGAGIAEPLAELGLLVFAQDAWARSWACVASSFHMPESASLQWAIDRFDEQTAQGAEPFRPEFAVLENIGASEDQRTLWRSYRLVELSGLFEPAAGDPRVFRLVRLRTACCLADARPAVVVGISLRPLDVQAGAWVTARGRIDFRQFPDGRWRPYLRNAVVQPSQMPANPYIN